MKRLSAHFWTMILFLGMVISHAVLISEPARMFFMGLGLLGIAGLEKRLNSRMTRMHGFTNF